MTSTTLRGLNNSNNPLLSGLVFHGQTEFVGSLLSVLVNCYSDTTIRVDCFENNDSTDTTQEVFLGSTFITANKLTQIPLNLSFPNFRLDVINNSVSNQLQLNINTIYTNLLPLDSQVFIKIDPNFNIVSINDNQLPLPSLVWNGTNGYPNQIMDISTTANTVNVISLPAITGSVSVSSLPAITGSVSVSSLPAITGSVSVSSLPAITGSVSVSSLPSLASGTNSIGNIVGITNTVTTKITNSVYQNASVLNLSITGHVVKSSAGTLRGITCVNSDSLQYCYVKIYDKATAPTSLDIPIATLPIYKNNNVTVDFFSLEMINGISIRASNGIANNDNTPSANCCVFVSYDGI